MREMKLVAWVKKHGRATRLGDNMVSVGSWGAIYFHPEITKRHFDGKKMELHYDEENRIIGLKPTVDGNGYKIQKTPGAYTNMICPRRFITSLKVKKGRYPTEWSEEAEMLIFQFEKRDEE